MHFCSRVKWSEVLDPLLYCIMLHLVFVKGLECIFLCYFLFRGIASLESTDLCAERSEISLALQQCNCVLKLGYPLM